MKKTNEKIENSNENLTNSNEKIENSIENIQNSNEKNENSNEKIPYYKVYYQKHKEEIKARRLQRLKEKQKENEELKVVDVKDNEKLKPLEKVKVSFWAKAQEYILAIFILSLIIGLIVYKWYFNKENVESE